MIIHPLIESPNLVDKSCFNTVFLMILKRDRDYRVTVA
jgi:hypothetical protein